MGVVLHGKGATGGRSGCFDFRRTQQDTDGLTASAQKAYNPVLATGGPARIPFTSSNEIARPVREWGWPGDRSHWRVAMHQRGQSTLEWVIGAAVILGTLVIGIIAWNQGLVTKIGSMVQEL